MLCYLAVKLSEMAVHKLFALYISNILILKMHDNPVAFFNFSSNSKRKTFFTKNPPFIPDDFDSTTTEDSDEDSTTATPPIRENLGTWVSLPDMNKGT